LFNLIVFVNEASFMTDFNWGGAYFTGLSETSTLTVNEIRIFERFPSIQIPADSQLVVLAQPSPKYDPQAVELYSVVSAMMPTGVPQKMNGFGEWFKEAVQEARNAIAPALAAIPHPLAQFAAGALRVGGSIADSYNKPPQVVSKAIPPPGAIYTPTGDTKTTVPRSVRTSIVMPAVQPIGAVQRNARRRRKRLLAQRLCWQVVEQHGLPKARIRAPMPSVFSRTRVNVLETTWVLSRAMAALPW